MPQRSVLTISTHRFTTSFATFSLAFPKAWLSSLSVRAAPDIKQVSRKGWKRKPMLTGPSRKVWPNSRPRTNSKYRENIRRNCGYLRCFSKGMGSGLWAFSSRLRIQRAALRLRRAAPEASTRNAAHKVLPVLEDSHGCRDLAQGRMQAYMPHKPELRHVQRQAVSVASIRLRT